MNQCEVAANRLVNLIKRGTPGTMPDAHWEVIRLSFLAGWCQAEVAMQQANLIEREERKWQSQWRNPQS